MKSLITFISFYLICQMSFAQAPEKMSYQAVVRNVSNALVTDTDIGAQISILYGTEIGPSVYTETHAVTTNSNGLMTIEVGTGTILTGSMDAIDWANGPFFIKSEIDPEGGTDYTITGTSQLITVPYAFYADEAGHATFSDSSSYSDYSAHADSSAHADHAFYADSADYATDAYHAVVADTVYTVITVYDSVGFDRAYLHMRKKATTQAIPSGSNTTITNYDIIDSENITLNNTTGVITFDVTGVYVLSAHTSFYADFPGRKIIWFECDSDQHPNRIASNESDGIANRLTTSLVGKFDAGDQIHFRVYQNTGVTTDCPSSAASFDETQIGIERIH